jgi:polysaccharide export outer membrane protein
VSVLVKEYNSKRISVFGQVENPGNFPYTERMHIVQAISLAGGFTPLAEKNETVVSRRVDGRERRVRVAVEAIGEGRITNFYLRPGDIIFVPERTF